MRDNTAPIKRTLRSADPHVLRNTDYEFSLKSQSTRRINLALLKSNRVAMPAAEGRRRQHIQLPAFFYIGI